MLITDEAIKGRVISLQLREKLAQTPVTNEDVENLLAYIIHLEVLLIEYSMDTIIKKATEHNG